MSLTGLEQVVGRLKLQFDIAKSDSTNKAITEMLIVGAGHAATMTPIESGNLINSQGRKTFEGANGWKGAVFYGAHYAPALEFASGKLKGKPRAGVESFTAYKGTQKERVAFSSNTGNFWDPDAEPHFLKKGMEEMAIDAPLILKKHYSV